MQSRSSNGPSNGTWVDAFPDLDVATDPAWQQAVCQVKQVTVPAGTTIFQCGDPCQNYLFVLSGSVRVVSLNPEGREVVLYHVGSGSTCTLTTSCLLGDTDYPAQGIAEREVQAVVMPRSVFNQLLTRSDGFRHFVFSQIGERMARLMYLVQEMAFERTHVRLIRKLLEGVDESGMVHATHAELAIELGTVREVISRLLKEFEHEGWVELSRGGIRLIDAHGLQRHIQV